MGDILIIGGGFAGLEAARFLSKNHLKLYGRRILLIDEKNSSDFLPLLPDVIGGRVGKKNVEVDLRDYLDRFRVNFQQGEVAKLDLNTREVFLKNGTILTYEFLIISCGSQTNFFGLDELKRLSLKVDNADDALNVVNTLTAYPQKDIFVVGGGYTGVEVAGNLALLLRRKKIKRYSVSIVEKGEDILGPLPEWMKDYCRLNLCALRVNVYTSCSLSKVESGFLKLSNGMEFKDYIVIWTAGVKTPSFVQQMKFPKDKQGRLVVDQHMMFGERCFAVGDAASFKHRGESLRMAVQFSISEAKVACANILRIISGEKSLLRYRPFDLGFLLPLATAKACGRVLFFKVSGILGWFLHYAICISRSLNFKNRFGIFCDIILKLGR